MPKKNQEATACDPDETITVNFTAPRHLLKDLKRLAMEHDVSYSKILRRVCEDLISGITPVPRRPLN